MIALDANILVYAHREDSPWHEAATRCVTALAEGRGDWAIPWPCLHEFLAIVTHPRIYRPQTPPELALDQVAALCLHHGVGELWSADRDFGRFAGLAVRNPLV